MARLKYDYNMLKSICDEGGVKLLEDYNDKYITRDTRIIAKCIMCENSFNKSLNKLHKQRNFGCETCSKIIKFDRIKNVMVEKYGVEYASQNETFMNKMKATCLEKYGVEYISQSQRFKNKIKQINMEKYGVEHFTQTDIMKEKTKQSVLNKYGVDHISQCNEIKEKTKKTNLEKYGVEYVTQCPEIHEKQTKNSYYIKDYTMPSGEIRKIQGYENFALDKLLNDNICENDIITGSKNVPKIWYIDPKDKKRRHFVDIFIPSLNKCIEVKSTWTYKRHIDIVFLKQQAAKELGYLYEIWVYDNKGNKVDSFH
jgi:hypothetical protein